MNHGPLHRFNLLLARFRCPVALVGLSCLCTGLRAEIDTSRLWVNAGFYSAHFDTHQGLRNANPGLGAEYRINDVWSVTAGRYLNSNDTYSNYVGGYYQPWRINNVKLGAAVGLFNGYPQAFNGGWFPAVLPTATWESGLVGLNVALVPPLKDRLYGALSVQLKFRFKE
jgi:hypothetical protein